MRNTHSNDSSLSSRPLVVRLDGEGRFLSVNDAYCDLFGRSPEELVGHWYMPLVHEDDKLPTELQMKQLWSPPHVCDLENRAMTVMGWRRLVWHARAQVDENGQVSEIHAFGMDVSDLDAAAAAREANWDRLAELLQEVKGALDPNSSAVQSLEEMRTLVETLRQL